ncbi:MAG: HAD-IIA family hydrolase [Arthrobacter sp.]|jgi:HAD superfamily hydrolase (TIGR01450 family)|nr:HAD-IIA family hydrolase [Arthrobacter sp.]
MTAIPIDAPLSGHDALLCDLDGVIYAGPDAIPGAVEAIAAVQAAGIAVGFVTNNASRPVEAVAEHLRSLGINTDAEHVFGSARAGARLAAADALSRGIARPTAMVVGADTLRHEVAAAGFDLVAVGAQAHPDYVIQGFDPGLGWSDLAAAAFAIQRGARWVASNTDATIPRAEGVAPGNGSLVDAVRRAVDVEPLVAGKPEPALMLLAAEALGATRPMMVGDRLDTDVAGGNAAGFTSALVLTGVHTADDAADAPDAQRPDVIVAGLGDLLLPSEHGTVAAAKAARA